MAENALQIRYRFQCRDGQDFDFLVRLDAKTLEHLFDEQRPWPEWTRLTEGQCEGCPLDPGSYARCPLALSLVKLVEHSGQILSYAHMVATVETPERTVSKETTAQKGVSSLLGLLIAASGCPHTAFLKPMARFHLPFATREETMYRAVSTYLVGQYFRHHRGKASDLDLTGLRAAYKRMQTVNAGLAKRLRNTCEGDANVNAISLLDLFAQEMPTAIEEKLGGIEYLFAPGSSEE